MGQKYRTLGDALARPVSNRTKPHGLRRLLNLLLWPLLRKPRAKAAAPHSLIANDRQGFMADLRLDAKTAVFDGSNIYHFGRDHDLNARPLAMLAGQLRDEGLRVVVFFDANIFYTLMDHGVMHSGQRHTIDALMSTFELRHDEVYVVPSGVQADRYIMNTLRYLPRAFVVSNDKFRDYAKPYRKVMKGQWRKGVKISKGELKLLQHRLERPMRVG